MSRDRASDGHGQPERRPARRRPATVATRATAPALAAQTRGRRGSKSSWLLIEPLVQSAPDEGRAGQQQRARRAIIRTAVPRSWTSWRRVERLPGEEPLRPRQQHLLAVRPGSSTRRRVRGTARGPRCTGRSSSWHVVLLALLARALGAVGQLGRGHRPGVPGRDAEDEHGDEHGRGEQHEHRPAPAEPGQLDREQPHRRAAQGVVAGQVEEDRLQVGPDRRSARRTQSPCSAERAGDVLGRAAALDGQDAVGSRRSRRSPPRDRCAPAAPGRRRPRGTTSPDVAEQVVDACPRRAAGRCR